MSLKEKYLKTYIECKQLMKKALKTDSETESHQSLNKMINIFIKDADTLKTDIEQTDSTDPDYEFCRKYLPLVYTQIGIQYVNIEQFSEGVHYFTKVIDLIEEPLLPDNVYVSVEARNKLGFVKLRQSNPEEALKFLQEAEKLYYDFRSLPNCVAKYVFEDMEVPPVLGEEELETAHTMTKLYLAQAYEVLKDLFKSSVYCHETLKRQLAFGYKYFNPIDWALNSAKLCQFFLDKSLFKQGRHYMAAASHVLDEYKSNLENKEGSQEEIEAEKEELRHRIADLSWCWAKYGIFILQHSKYTLSNPKDDVEDEKHEDLERLLFDCFDLTRYEDQVTDVDVVTFEDARKVFLFSQKHFNKAKEFYTLEDRASKHVQIVQDHSQLFHMLSAFEPDKERQFKMLKKRADMLEVVVKELNPRYYLDLCRQLWVELGEVYHDMMELTSEKVEEVPNPQTLKKINSLIESSAKNFNLFLDSTKDKMTGELPDPIEEDLIAPILTAQFFLGRLHLKCVMPKKRFQGENMKKAYECFKYLVDYCDKSEEAKAIADGKYQISKELITLLQITLLQL